jgi:hypothetical protein
MLAPEGVSHVPNGVIQPAVRGTLDRGRAGDDVEATALNRRPLSLTAWCDSVRQSERGSQIVPSLT